MSSSTGASLPPRTTSSGLKTEKIRSPSEKHLWVRTYSKPEQVGLRFQSMEIISPERGYDTPSGGAGSVVAVCHKCGTEQLVTYSNLTGRKRDGCPACGTTQQNLSWLTRRFADRRGVCENLSDPRYGGRGIEFRFETPFAAAIWMRDNCGLHPEMEIDRVDNDGHYEPGNLRWASKSQQMRNNSRTVLREWNQDDWPYCEGQVRQMVNKGMSREDIVRHAEEVVEQRGPWWKTIAARLESMTL